MSSNLPGDDDQLIDGLVKAATSASNSRTDPQQREMYRRKARQFNRVSLRRTRTLQLVNDQLPLSGTL